ncbi:MAG: hypothetical protein HY293_01540 [Planctomycetes bacterium]|nr:hypothetical protein [Planctomycetota bacterium]
MNHADPGLKKRWIRAILGSMAAGLVIAGLTGSVPGLLRGPARWWETFRIGINTAAVVFWIAFVYSYFLHVRKTPANLEAERLNRLAEEIYRRGGPTPLQAPGRRR